jgi:hypothetical protein
MLRRRRHAAQMQVADAAAVSDPKHRTHIPDATNVVQQCDNDRLFRPLAFHGASRLE